MIRDNVAPAKIAEGAEIRQGEKGLPIVIGAILVESLAAGAVKKLLDCIKVWRGAREREFKIHVEKDGKVIKVSSSNVGEQEIVRLTEQLEALLTR